MFVKLEHSGLVCYVKGVFARIFGLSDNDIAIETSFAALAGMRNIIKDYNICHGLKFSTNPNPSMREAHSGPDSTNHQRLPSDIIGRAWSFELV